MESQGDAFISDLKKRMSSEVTQCAKLLRIMKARVMTKRCRRCSQGLGGKIADWDPCWYMQQGKWRKKNNCNLTYITVGNELTLTPRILFLSIFMKFSLIFFCSHKSQVFLGKKKENKAESIVSHYTHSCRDTSVWTLGADPLSQHHSKMW